MGFLRGEVLSSLMLMKEILKQSDIKMSFHEFYNDEGTECIEFKFKYKLNGFEYNVKDDYSVNYLVRNGIEKTIRESLS